MTFLRFQKKTNKHKQLLEIMLGMGGGQICSCVTVFLDKKGNTSAKFPGNPGTVPGQPVKRLFVRSLVYSFSDPMYVKMQNSGLQIACLLSGEPHRALTAILVKSIASCLAGATKHTRQCSQPQTQPIHRSENMRFRLCCVSGVFWCPLRGETNLKKAGGLHQNTFVRDFSL